jgi:hypothetical protein
MVQILKVVPINARTVPLWEMKVVTLVVNRRGLTKRAAMHQVVTEWMAHGNYKPLAAAIRRGPVDDRWLKLLADQIEAGRLKLQHGKRGKPRDPEAKFRNALGSAMYERSHDLAGVADCLGMSEAAVLKAVTARRRSKKLS